MVQKIAKPYVLLLALATITAIIGGIAYASYNQPEISPAERRQQIEIQAKTDYEEAFTRGYTSYHERNTSEFQRDVLLAKEDGEHKVHLPFRDDISWSDHNPQQIEGFHTGFIKAMKENLPELKIEDTARRDWQGFIGVYAEW